MLLDARSDAAQLVNKARYLYGGLSGGSGTDGQRERLRAGTGGGGVGSVGRVADRGVPWGGHTAFSPLRVGQVLTPVYSAEQRGGGTYNQLALSRHTAAGGERGPFWCRRPVTGASVLSGSRTLHCFLSP